MPLVANVTAKFTPAKETKNTVKYDEIVDDKPPIIGSLYLQKYIVKQLGNPDELTVTVSVG